MKMTGVMRLQLVWAAPTHALWTSAVVIIHGKVIVIAAMNMYTVTTRTLECLAGTKASTACKSCFVWILAYGRGICFYKDVQ